MTDKTYTWKVLRQTEINGDVFLDVMITHSDGRIQFESIQHYLDAQFQMVLHMRASTLQAVTDGSA